MFYLQAKLYLFCNTQVLQSLQKKRVRQRSIYFKSCPAITFLWSNLPFSYTLSCQYDWQNLKGTQSAAGVNQSRIWRQWAYTFPKHTHGLQIFCCFCQSRGSMASWARVSFLNIKKHHLPTCKLKKFHVELLRHDEHGYHNTIFGHFSEWSHALDISL